MLPRCGILFLASKLALEGAALAAEFMLEYAMAPTRSDSDSTAIVRKIRAGVQDHAHEMESFLRALIATPTENPPGREYRKCVRLITHELKKLNFQYQVFEVPTPKGIGPRFCILSFFGTGRRTLYFHGHYDVVPASSPGQFAPVRRRNNLFGRGSSDMKAGLVAMLFAVVALREHQIPLDGRIGLVFVPDEETGGAYGSRYLAESGFLGREGIGMLTPEPTGGVIWNACRGALSVRVRIKGKPVHVGLQHRGVNAFERMMEVAGELQRFKHRLERRRTRYAARPEAARRSILMLGGEVHGGTNFNVVPGECTFTIERRINPEEDLISEKQQLLGVLRRLQQKGLSLDFEIFQQAGAAGFSPREPVAQALADAVRAVTGRLPRFEMCPGLLETRFYAEKHVPAFAYGPGLLTVSHGPNEFVPLANITACATIYALTAAAILRPCV